MRHFQLTWLALLVSSPAWAVPELDCAPPLRLKSQKDSGVLRLWCEGQDLLGRWLKNGPYEEWYDEDHVKMRGSYYDGKRDGPWFTFAPSGQQTGSAEFSFGTLIRGKLEAVGAESPEPATLPIVSTASTSSPPKHEAAGDSHRRGPWNGGTIALQVVGGLGGAIIGAIAGSLVAVPLANSCETTDCKAVVAYLTIATFYFPLNSLAVWLVGNSAMGVPGDYGATLVGALIAVVPGALISLASPEAGRAVGLLLGVTSAGAIIGFHLSAESPDTREPGTDFSFSGLEPSRSLPRPDVAVSLLNLPF
ncbi:MAG: hypothetical protein HY791_06770 [Deltaproteobacteria bacterium]|nr:hypothetical protein [Deltaproteobacteria bacterium]